MSLSDRSPDRSPDRSRGPAPASSDPSSRGVRFRLKDETTAAHERVDALFSSFDLTTADGYAAFLAAQAGAFPAIEAALTQAGAAAVIPDWAERLRADALTADLAALEQAAPLALASPGFDTPAAILGGAYVLEGSRLGGQMLKRSVPEGQPVSFMTTSDPRLWRTFVALLEQRLTEQGEIDQAISSALATFAVFERSATLALQQDRP